MSFSVKKSCVARTDHSQMSAIASVSEASCRRIFILGIAPFTRKLTRMMILTRPVCARLPPSGLLQGYTSRVGGFRGAKRYLTAGDRRCLGSDLVVESPVQP